MNHWQRWNKDPGVLFRPRQFDFGVVSEIDIPPHTRVLGHQEAGLHFCFVIRGTFIERIEGEAVPFSAGRLRVSPPGTVHDMHYGSRGARCVVAHLEPAWPGDRMSYLDRTWADAAPRWARLGRRIAVLLQERESNGLSLELALLEALALASGGRPDRAPESAAPWLSELRDRLHDQNGRAGSLNALAASVGRHPSHVARSFRAAFGLSIGQYARRVRVEAARRALQGSDERLSVIAAAMGFADQSHMTRAVRSHFGDSPRRLRHAARSSDAIPVQDSGGPLFLPCLPAAPMGRATSLNGTRRDMKLFPLAGALLAGVVCTSRAMAQDLVLPETPAARVAAGWIDAFNSADIETMRRFFLEHGDAEALKSDPVEARIDRYRQYRGHLLPLAYTRLIESTPTMIRLAGTGQAGTLPLMFTVRVAEADPHGLVSVEVAQGGP